MVSATPKKSSIKFLFARAGVEGIEPSLVALEANVLPLDDTPMDVHCTHICASV